MQKLIVILLLVASFNSTAGIMRGHYGYISFKVEDGRTWFTITNTFDRTVRCYAAVDGFKVRMTLQANVTSKWYRAEKFFSYTDVSWRCDPS